MMKVVSSIAVAPGSNLVVNGSVSFATTIGALPGNVDPALIYVQLRVVQGQTLVWSQTGHPNFIFPFGIGQPTSTDGAGVGHGYGYDNFLPAHAVADLFYWGNGGQFNVLASTEFDVAGL